MTTILKLNQEYGEDFLKKLPLYKTAKRNGEYVKILQVSGTLVMVENQNGFGSFCCVTELSDFCL